MTIKDLADVSSTIFDVVVYYAHKQLGYDEKKVRQFKGYVLLNPESGCSCINGYVLYKNRKNGIYIDWIFALGGNGMKLMKFVEKHHKIITLKLSIDPGEKKSVVMRRINFYIKLNYRVVDIKFREKHGPLLTMMKSIK